VKCFPKNLDLIENLLELARKIANGSADAPELLDASHQLAGDLDNTYAACNNPEDFSHRY
jgi:hypothetical protein